MRKRSGAIRPGAVCFTAPSRSPAPFALLTTTSVAAKGTPEQQAILVTSPQNIKDMLVLNEEQCAIYSTKYEEAWNKFQLG